MRRKFLVALDALLDTRLGAMRVFNEGLWMNTWRDPGYYNRLMDDYDHFGQGTTEMWRNVYNQRGVALNEKGESKVLRASNMTMMVGVVGNLIRDMYAQTIDDPTIHGCDVYINTFPYTLDAIEQDEICLAMEELMLPGAADDGALLFDTKFSCVDISHDALTLDVLREDWNIVIMYDFGAWFDVQAQRIYESQRGATLTQMYVPEILRDKLTRQQLRAPDGSIQNPFTESKRYLSLSLQLTFWTPGLFSIPNPFELIPKEA